MRSRSRFFVLVVAAVALPTSAARATTVLATPLDTLARSSAVIVHATVSNVEEADPAKPFTTTVELEVAESIKGLPATERTLTLELPGGRDGELAMYIPGSPRVAVGDEVVLLLERVGDGRLAPAGLAQGVFKIERTNAEPVVRRELGGAHYVDAQGNEAVVPPVPRTLGELTTRLRALSTPAVPQ
jgi:hypothetical protein